MARGLALILLAILLWSTQAFVTKLLVTSLSFIWVYFLSSVLAGATLLVLYFAFNKKAKVSQMFAKPKRILIISVLLGAANFLLFASFTMLQASSVVVTLYIYPVLMAVFNSVLFTKKADSREFAAIALGFLGMIVFVTGGSLTKLQLANPMAYLLVLGGAVTWALYLIVQKHFNLEVTSSNGVAFLVSAFFVLPLIPTAGVGALTSLANPQLLAMLVYFGVMTFGVANIMCLNGLRTTKVINGAICSYMTPVLAVVLNYLVLGDLVFWYDFVPIACVFMGFLIINWNSVKSMLPRLSIGDGMPKFRILNYEEMAEEVNADRKE